MDTLHAEKITVKKKEVELKLVADIEQITRQVQDFSNQLEEMRKNPVYTEEYSYSENDDQKSPEEVISQCETDVNNLSDIFGGGADSLQLFLNKQIEKELGVEMNTTTSTLDLNWPKLFKEISKKADGTFAKGRVVTLYSCEGFSWEDMEAYGRRGYELVIKNISDTEAELQLRMGMVEKW